MSAHVAELKAKASRVARRRLGEELRKDQVENAIRGDALFMAADNLRACESLKWNKACGEGGVVAEMYQDAERIGRHWVCARDSTRARREGTLLGRLSSPTAW